MLIFLFLVGFGFSKLRSVIVHVHFHSTEPVLPTALVTSPSSHNLYNHPFSPCTGAHPVSALLPDNPKLSNSFPSLIDTVVMTLVVCCRHFHLSSLQLDLQRNFTTHQLALFILPDAGLWWLGIFRLVKLMTELIFRWLWNCGLRGESVVGLWETK